MLLGEVTQKGSEIDFDKLARDVCKQVGYDSDEKGLDYKTMELKQVIVEQEPEIAAVVYLNKKEEDLGAGD